MGFSGTWASVFLVTGILTWTNQNLNQKHFRLQRKTTKMYRILNKYPSHGVMSRSHESLRCRIPWVSRTGRGHTFLTTPVTPECIRFPKCVHRVNRFLAGQNKPHRAQLCSSYTASSCTWVPAFQDNLAAIGYHSPCDWQHGLGFLLSVCFSEPKNRELWPFQPLHLNCLTSLYHGQG